MFSRSSGSTPRSRFFFLVPRLPVVWRVTAVKERLNECKEDE